MLKYDKVIFVKNVSPNIIVLFVFELKVPNPRVGLPEDPNEYKPKKFVRKEK